MTMYEFLAGSGGVLFIIATIIEIAPVKINPWSKLAKMFEDTNKNICTSDCNK